MAANKNALLRYRILDYCFRDFSHRYTIDNLASEVDDVFQDLYGTKGVSSRQLLSDIEFLKDRLTYNAPIKTYPVGEGQKCYYRYCDSDFSIFKNNISPKEMRRLHSVIDMLKRYRGLQGYSWVEETISQLEFQFGFSCHCDSVVSFEQNPLLRGLNFLEQAIDSAVNHTPLFITYKSYRGKEIVSTVHPYHVKQYNNRWFLFGYEQETGLITNRALDRIQRMEAANVEFIPNRDIDFEHYFDDIIGVSVPRREVATLAITLRFAPKRFPYVVSKPLHHSQRIISKDDCTLTISVKPTRELDQQIFSFGPDVEVVAPASYREHISGMIKELKKLYLDEDNSEIPDNHSVRFQEK